MRFFTAFCTFSNARTSVERTDQRLVAVIALLAVGEDAFLRRRVVDQPVLPFAGLAVVADRRVQRRVAAETAVHVDDVLRGDAEALGDQFDLIGPQIAFLERRALA